MRILLASEYFYPQSKGGTEMYVYQLAKQLIENGHHCEILSLSDSKQVDIYDEIKINYIPFVKNIFSDEEKPRYANLMLQIINEYKPDIYHQHTLSPSLSVNHLKIVKDTGYKTILTAHVPGLTCERGDLLQNGETVCDGFVSYNKCWNCVMNSKGYTNPFLINGLKQISNSSIGRKVFPSLALIKNKIDSIDDLKTYLDFVVVVSEWQKKVLMLNGFNENSITVCRQSVDEKSLLNRKVNNFKDKLQMGFVGRIVPVKGLHLLLRALDKCDQNKFNLKIAGIYSSSHQEYYNENKSKSLMLNADWKEDLSADEIEKFLDTLDVLVVPSVWLETGPYVIYEALSRKIPVISFNRGGAVELIKNNENGILVDTEEELNLAVRRVIDKPEIITEFTSNIDLKRTTKDLFNEMEVLYTEALHKN